MAAGLRRFLKCQVFLAYGQSSDEAIARAQALALSVVLYALLILLGKIFHFLLKGLPILSGFLFRYVHVRFSSFF